MRPAFILFGIICLITASRASAFQRDTIYKHGDFLIEATGPMKIDFITKGKRFKQRTSKGDTLYHDSKYTILGERSKLMYTAVYKKYRSKYKFSMFRVRAMYKGRLAPPDFKTDPKARLFKTEIRDQCKDYGINFAGHYTVIEWGCGTECESIAIVDRISGAIFYSGIRHSTGDEAFNGVKYKPGSRMMVMNSYSLDNHKGYELVRDYKFMRTHVMEWTGSGFKKLP
jgi:hypothetical protein